MDKRCAVVPKWEDKWAAEADRQGRTNSELRNIVTLESAVRWQKGRGIAPKETHMMDNQININYKQYVLSLIHI